MKENKMNYQSVFKEYARPMMVRGVLNSLMHTADRIIAALFIGAQALVATTLTSPMMYLTYALSAMFIGGMAAYVGLLIGKEKSLKASQSASGILLILAILGFVMTIPTFLFNVPLVKFLGARGDMITLASDYLKIFAFTFPFMLLGRGLDVLICNDGNPSFSFKLNILTTTLNLGLNILAVAVFDLGIMGLAGATVISEGILFMGGLYYFSFKSKVIKLTLPKIKVMTVIRIAYNGLSDFAMLLVDAVMVFIVNQAFVKFLTPSHFEAYAGANILMILFYAVFMGATGGLQPMFSQLMGQKKVGDLKKLLNYSIRRTMVIGIVLYITFIPIANIVLGLFVDGKETLKMAQFFYMTMGFAVLFSNLPLQTSMFFTAINRPLESAAISIVRTLVMIPLIAYFAIMYIGPIGVSLGFLIADLILICILVVYMKRLDISKLKVYE